MGAGIRFVVVLSGVVPTFLLAYPLCLIDAARLIAWIGTDRFLVHHDSSAEQLQKLELAPRYLVGDDGFRMLNAEKPRDGRRRKNGVP